MRARNAWCMRETNLILGLFVFILGIWKGFWFGVKGWDRVGVATGKGKVMEGVAARGRKRWSASEMGSFTVNVDTALKSGVGRAGCVIQEDIGALVAYASIPIFQLSDQKHAKVVDVLEGLKLAKDLGLKNVVLEMDCKALLEDVNIPDMDFSDLGRLIEEIRDEIKYMFK